jgi:penicillin amidase
MHIALKVISTLTITLAVAAAGAAAWYIHTKQPVRSGSLQLKQLKAPVSVAYDERGVPHIQAQNEPDLYRALGYVHAQDRLFQMEMVRRLALGELAEILGPDLIETDQLFRTLGIRARADEVVSRMDKTTPGNVALLAYIDGINQYQASRKAPIEFDVLKIPKRPFTPQDTIAVTGYLAYSFAAAFKTDPIMTIIRDKLGPDYLRVFDLAWHPEGVVGTSELVRGEQHPPGLGHLLQIDQISQLAQLSQRALSAAGIPQFRGSNAWVVSGRKTASGKPLLAGDPHIDFSAPAVWYEAHLSAPGFDLYGHYQALNPVALLGHNQQFGWSLTMFQNDDIDLIAEKVNPDNPNQVWYHGNWVDLQTRTETIKVKGAPAVKLALRRSPHGPIITDVFKASVGTAPTAMWWAFLETENSLVEAFYELNRANTRAKARSAVEKINAPGLNVLWASTNGDIAWWAAGKLPIRPLGVNPAFILDGSTHEADKLGFYHFNFNPQEENPQRGYIVSANHQPKPPNGVPVPGYYNLADRAERLDSVLREPDRKWDMASAQALQLHSGSGYGPRLLKELMPMLKGVTTDPYEKAFLEPLDLWDGNYSQDSVAALLFAQLRYEFAHATMADELGEVQFNNLLATHAIDAALPLLAADVQSPWWDDVNTKKVENRFEIMRVVWINTLDHLESLYGKDLLQWTWGRAHTLTHNHPLGMRKPFGALLNVGPFTVAGGRETPNNMDGGLGTGPWPVVSGPSTRRVIDFANPSQAQGINPLGQSGVLFNAHYSDQSERFSLGYYVPQHLSAADVKANTQSTLTLKP